MKKRFLNLLLTLALVICALPVVALAAEKTEKECNHASRYENKVAVIEPGTCQTPGKVKYECTASDWFIFPCDEEWVKEEITVTCHPTDVEAKAPTCTEVGNSAGITCTDCGQDKTKCAYCAEHLAEVIPANGHDEIELEAVEATCGNSGLTAGLKCDVCGEILVEQQIIPKPTEHDFSDFIRYTLEPTCTTDGEALYGCKTCDAEDTIPVEADHLAEVVGSWDPTCSQIGCTIYRCEREGCGHVWYVSVEMLEHTEDILEAVPATCTTDGKEAGLWCTVCKEILEEQEVIPMLGHDWKDVDAKKATCTVNGNNAYKECQTCKVTLNKEIIPAAHDFSKNPNKCSVCQARNPGCQHTNASITTTKEATCKESGTQTFACPDCGDTFVETLPKLSYHNYVDGVCSWCKTESCNHSYSTERVEPTCTENGYEKTYCVSCGKVTKSQPLTKRGHDFNNSVIDGFCSRCGSVNPNANKTNDLQDIFFIG